MTVAVHNIQRLEMLTAKPMHQSRGLKANKKILCLLWKLGIH